MRSSPPRNPGAPTIAMHRTFGSASRRVSFASSLKPGTEGPIWEAFGARHSPLPGHARSRIVMTALGSVCNACNQAAPGSE